MNLKWALIFVLFPSLASAQNLTGNRAIVFGGNCDSTEKRQSLGLFGMSDERPPQNLFKEDFASLTRALRSRNWSVDPLFDGDPARCKIPYNDSRCTGSGKDPLCCPPKITNTAFWSGESIAKEAGLPNERLKHGSKADLLSSLDQIIGSESAPKQLLLVFFSHGSPEIGEKKHGICLDDGSYLSIDDADLRKRLVKIKDKGTKLGFIDGSCYAGASVDEFSSLGCVLASQSKSEATLTNTGILDGLIDVLTMPDKHHAKLHSVYPAYAPDGAPSLDDVFLNTLIRHQDIDSLRGMANNPQISGFTEIQSLCRAPQVTVHELSSKEEERQECEAQQRQEFKADIKKLLVRLEKENQCALYKEFGGKSLDGKERCLDDFISSTRGLDQEIAQSENFEDQLSSHRSRIGDQLQNLQYPVTYKLWGPLKGHADAFARTVCVYYYGCKDVKIEGDVVRMIHNAESWRLFGEQDGHWNSREAFSGSGLAWFIAHHMIDQEKIDLGQKIPDHPSDDEFLDKLGEWMREAEIDGTLTLDPKKQELLMNLQLRFDASLVAMSRQLGKQMTARTERKQMELDCRFFSFLAARAVERSKGRSSACSSFKVF